MHFVLFLHVCYRFHSIFIFLVIFISHSFHMFDKESTYFGLCEPLAQPKRRGVEWSLPARKTQFELFLCCPGVSAMSPSAPRQT